MAKIGAIFEGEYLPHDEYLERKAQAARNRSALSCPMLASDNLDYVMSMADGKRYTSKAKMRAEYRRLGVNEIGNEKLPMSKPVAKPEGIRADLRAAIRQSP